MSLVKSIATFGGFTLLSRITGFMRDMVLANFLGAGLMSDAFFVAFKLPNLFRSLFAEGAFTAAFVPMLSGKMATEGQDKAIKFASTAISILAFFLTIFVILMEIFMPAIVYLMAPGFLNDPGKMELSITLSRITFPFLLFISIASFQSGILNSMGKFAATGAAPIILSLMMIASVYIFVPFSPSPAYGIAIGVTVAGILEVFCLAYFLKRQNVLIRPELNIRKGMRDPEIKTLFKRIAPGVLGSGIYQINMVVDTIIVSLVGTGAISWLYYANRLQQLPLGVVGAAISVAILPVLSKHLKSEEHEQACQVQNKACEYGALLSIPAAVALIILAEPIVAILFQHGRFGAFETKMTAQAVIAYSFGLPPYVLVKALAPNFFARGDTKTPVKYSIVVLVANLVLCIILMKPFGHVGVASATAAAAFVSLYQYIRGLKKRGYWTFTSHLTTQVIKITISSLIMGAIIIGAEKLFNLKVGNWLESGYSIKIPFLAFLCFLGLASFGIAAKIIGVMSFSDILEMILRRRTKNAKTQS